MEQRKASSGWKVWLRPNRIVPLLTLLVAGSSGVLSLFGVLKLTPVEGIIIALLALLAIDSLTERLSILEKIEARLSTYSSSELLKNRSQLPHPDAIAQTASEITLLGVSGISLFVNHLGFLEQKMKAGCKLRFVLLDPNSVALQTWNLLMKVTTTEADIKTALELLKGLSQTEKAKGRCEVRLSKVFVPFAMLIVDPKKETGFMNVEFYTYKTALSDRPHIQLSRTQNPIWFDFFVTQFEQIWSDSEKWTP